MWSKLSSQLNCCLLILNASLAGRLCRSCFSYASSPSYERSRSESCRHSMQKCLFVEHCGFYQLHAHHRKVHSRYYQRMLECEIKLQRLLSGRLRKSNLVHFAAVCLTNVTQLTPALSKADFQILGTSERCTCRFVLQGRLVKMLCRNVWPAQGSTAAIAGKRALCRELN